VKQIQLGTRCIDVSKLVKW